MNKPLLQELLKLSPAERLELVHELWDSIPSSDVPALTDAQVEEIERRMAEHQRDPSRASSWDEVRARLCARFG